MVCRFSIFACFILAFFVFAGNVQAQTCPYTLPDSPMDRDILILLYCDTDGEDWIETVGEMSLPVNWLTHPSLSNDWSGVRVDFDGQVTELTLYNYGLVGEIPKELGKLSNLELLRLDTNELSGTIPEELGDLSNLLELYLDTNQLSGTIPTELGNLSNLNDLTLFKNQLSGTIPGVLGELPFGKFSFFFGGTLDLSDNKLSGTIPEELGDLSNLWDLTLSNNQLSGTIPEELGNSSKLLELYLDTNQLSGTIPEELGNLSNLQFLYLSDNQLSGTIPTELGDLSKLHKLSLSDNQLSGTIPEELGNFSKLVSFPFVELYLGDNQLSGTIPEELGELTDLRVLHLHENQLSGTIPTELGELTDLKEIALWGNEFTGTIPEELLGVKVDRAVLRLFYQSTGGDEWTVDTNWLKSFESFFVWHGVATDSDSNDVDARATGLNLESNELKGEIPVALGVLTNLESLNFADNTGLTGALPLNLTELSSLTTLNISGTGLCVPTDLKDWLVDKTITSGGEDCVKVAVSFGLSSYSVAEGGTVDVQVTLSPDPERTVEIPLTVISTNVGNADYSVPASVTFPRGETSKYITVTTTDNNRYQGNKTVVLAFDMPLPPDVSESTPSSTTVTIRDDERRPRPRPPPPPPAVKVSFGSSFYSVTEGETVDVQVTLSADPKRTVMIPLTIDQTTTAGAGDYSLSQTSVTFTSGETSKNITLTATDDVVDDDNEVVVLAFGTFPQRVSEGTQTSATVSIGDNDDPNVSVQFASSVYSVTEGETVDVQVTLSADPERTVTIPLTIDQRTSAGTGDYSLSQTSVTFASGETSKDITLTATDDDVDDDGEVVVLAFGTLPWRVSGGTQTSATVSIGDNDDPNVSVQFASSVYSVTEGETVDVQVTLSADPERTVTIPLAIDQRTSAGSGDYSLSQTSVTFASGETSKDITLTATDDVVDDDNEVVVLAFGTLPWRVSGGTQTSATVSIGDNDDPNVSVQFASSVYSVPEDEAVDVRVTLSADPERTVTIPITIDQATSAAAEDYSLSSTSVTFASGEISKDITLTATDDDVDDDGEVRG